MRNCSSWLQEPLFIWLQVWVPSLKDLYCVVFRLIVKEFINQIKELKIYLLYKCIIMYTIKWCMDEVFNVFIHCCYKMFQQCHLVNIEDKNANVVSRIWICVIRPRWLVTSWHCGSNCKNLDLNLCNKITMIGHELTLWIQLHAEI